MIDFTHAKRFKSNKTFTKNFYFWPTVTKKIFFFHKNHILALIIIFCQFLSHLNDLLCAKWFQKKKITKNFLFWPTVTKNRFFLHKNNIHSIDCNF